jgi:hypothetical protein
MDSFGVDWDWYTTVLVGVGVPNAWIGDLGWPGGMGLL